MGEHGQNKNGQKSGVITAFAGNDAVSAADGGVRYDGDGVETQGAIVSENGTGVSDDSNSSGNTDDLQVGGSKDSGTADDTTGAEGGADPTDSVNGNDSADPQDDGDAVLPVASSVVSTSEELVAAIAAANDGDTITLGEGEFTTYGNTSPEKSLTFVGAGTGTVWTIGDLDKDVGGEGNGDCSFDGCETITFQNMTLKSDGADYRGFIRISNTAVKKCTLVGKTAYWGYETAKFEDSTFNAPVGDYALWDYSTKAMTFEGCTFNISGKGVNVYVEQPSTDARTVEVNGCTVNSDKAGKAFLNIKNSTQAFDVTLSGTNTVTGLEANGTTGSALYQVETTEVTETTGNPVTVKQENKAGELETVYEVKQPSANVAKVGDTEYATLDEAIAALSSNSYTLQLLDETAWNAATPVYWAAGSKSGYVATLADALTAAYKANAGGITIVCRPDANVGELTHGHVADDITIYGNNAYISSGECELEVDTYMFSRETGKQVTTGGAYLEKDITVTAYELDNLGVWGQRHTDHKVTVNLTDCDSVNGITVQRVYISGTTGVNDITLTGCDFGTKATSVYSNADGKVVIDNCSFTGAQVPVNFNHKANGTQTVTVQSSKFTNCGDNGDWKQFAAPVRFVNSGSGTMNTTVGNCAFTGTVGGNGDILLGDGREGEKSNDVKLTVENTAANVQAQQPGYYAKDGTTDETKQGTRNVAAGDKLTTSVTQLMPSSETTYVAEVNGTEYKTLQAAIDKAGRNATVRLLADTRENVTIAEMMTLDLNGHTLNGGTEKGKPALTVTARVTVKDSSAAKTGTIMREDTAANSGVSSHYVIDVQGAGWLTFESGNVKNNSGTDSGKGASLVRVGDDSVDKYPGLNIKGGTFTQDNFIVIKVDSGDLFLNGGTLNSANSYAIEDWHRATIKGGTVNGTVAVWTYSGGHNSDLTIKGGTVNGNVASVSYDKAEGKLAKVSISGGTVDGTLGTYTYGNGLIPINDATKATIAVTGGTFSSDPTKYVVEDSGVTPNADGTYGVAKAYLAKVGDTSYYTMDEAFKAQTASGEAIVLLRDYTTGSTFNSGTVKRTVDLNGHTWTCTGTDANSAAFEINNPNATLTVKNGKVVSSQLVGLIPSAMGGTIKYDNSSLVFDGVEMTTTAHSGIETNGNNTNDTVTLKNSTLNVPNGFGIYFPSSGTLTIDNSVINAQTMGVQVCAGSLNISGAKTAITVSGDGIPKTINDGAIEDGAAISIVNRTGYKGLSKIEVEGGKFTAKGGNAAVKAYNWKDLTPSDFTQNDKVSVSGGTFSSAVDKSLCANGYIPTQNADGTYGVKEGKYVAEIGSQGYESLTEAINAAQDGQTVTLLADAAEDVVISKSITLDLGGKTLTNTNAGKATISVTGGTVTVKNGNVVGGTGYYNIEVTKGSNANLTLTDVTAKAGNNGSSMIDNWGTLTITSGTYTGGMNTVKSEEGSVLNISGGTFTCDFGKKWSYTAVILVYGTTTITGGEFIQKTTNTSSYAKVVMTGKVDGYEAFTKVTGGTFTNEKLSGIFYGLGDATSDNFEVSGGTFNKYVSDSYMAEGFIPVKNANGTYGVKEGKFVAEVGSTGYETLDEAIAAANASTKSATIYLRENITVDHQLVIENAKGKAITLNLESFTLTSTYAINKAIKNGSYALVNNTPLTIENGTFAAGQARAIGALATLTLRDKATVTQQLTGGHACVAFCADGKTYTIKDSTIEGAYAVCSFANNATIRITGSTLTGTGNTLYHNGSNYGLKLTVTDTTITSSGSCGVYISGSTSAQSNAGNQNGAGGYQQAIFTGCTISGATNGVEVKYTDLTLDGCTVSTTAKDASYKQDNNGPAGSGFAVVSTDNAMNNVTPKPEGTIIIKGTGKYTGPVGLGSLKSVKETYADFADETIKISGGTFTTEVPAAYCADGFIPTQNDDGTYGVKVGQYVAKVGSTKYETLADAIRLAAKGKTITLLADVADCGSLTISKNITLDGSGHTISGNSSISVNMPGKAAADVTIKNVNFKDIANGNKLSAFYFSQVKGKLTITGCTFDSIEYEAIQVTPMEGAEVNVSNNVFKAKADGTQVRHIHIEMAYGSGFDCEGQNIKLTVTDNQLHGTVSGDASMGIWWVGTDSTLKVDGNYMEHPETVSITLSNSGVHYNRGDLIYPARSQADADVDDLIPAVIVAEKASGESKIKAYSTLAEAINAAENGQTVRLLADVEQNTQLAIDKSITLDLNGKTIKNTADIWGDNANAILSIKNGAKVTITGNGTIDAKENDCYTINVAKGDLTIENGTFYGNVSVVQVQEGTLSVKGGTFDLHQKWEGSSKYLFNCIDSEFTSGNAKVAISGGTFVDFDPNVSPEQKVDGKTPSFAAPGVGITKNENGSFTAVDGMTAQILDKDGNSVKAYRTLADAVAAAEDGQTVRLLADVAESSIKVNANITIDLNKMTVTGSFVTYGEVTIQNGTIDVPDGKTNYAYGKLTLADVDITGKAASSSLLSVNYNGSVTIDKDSTIVADSAKGDYPAVFIKGQDDSGKTYAPELNIYGTVQSAKTPAIQGNGTDRGVSHVNVFEGAVVKSEKLAIYLPQPCEVNITGGLVEGYCGIGIKSGTLNISGGTVRGVANDNVIGDEYSQTNGISYDGSAIMIDSYIGYAGQVQINISGNAVVESKYSTAIREIGNDKSQTNLVGLDITGGTVLGAKDTDAVLVRDVTAKDVNISGGEFSSIVKKEYCAPGFTPVTTANSEGRYGVEIGMFTVMVTSRTTGSDSPVANVAGGGSNITYAQGTTVTASAISGYKFVGWFANEYTGTPYSTDLSCEVKPTADCTMIAVYEPISGGKFWLTVTASEFTVNGGAVQDSYLYEQFAVGASVTVNFTGSENFLYWVNASNKVVSTDKSYTFIMGSETTLKAVYGKARQNQATVVFISHSDQIISSKAYTTSDTIQFPVPPIKMGCTFTGWSMTEAEIRAAMANNSGIIQVRALYTNPSIACKVTVVYPEGTDNQVVNAVVGKAIDVTAKDIEGKTFSYWTDDKGTVLGYTKTLKLAPSGDMTVKAVYDQAAEAKPVITMSEVSATTANESYVVTFMATRAVPNGYKVVKQGILWSRDAVCGEDGAAAYMQFDSNGKLPDGVRAYIGNNLDLNGVTRYDITTKYNDRTFYGRGYMVLESDAGKLLYIYTDTIASGSYDSLTK